MPRKTRFDRKQRRREIECDREDLMVKTPRVLSDRAKDVFAAAVYEVAAHPGKYKDVAEEKEDQEDLI